MLIKCVTFHIRSYLLLTSNEHSAKISENIFIFSLLRVQTFDPDMVAGRRARFVSRLNNAIEHEG